MIRREYVVRANERNRSMEVCPGSGQPLRDSRCAYCGQITKARFRGRTEIDSAGIAQRHSLPPHLRSENLS